MKKQILTFVITLTISVTSCSSEGDNKNSATNDSSTKDSAHLASHGADGTAKSLIGTTKDSTIMGTPPEKKK